MGTVSVCEKSVDLNCMKQLSDHEVVLYFVATKASEHNDNVNNNNNKNKNIGIETTDKWYTHMPKPVCEIGDVTVLWNQVVHTDRKVTANRPDIIIKNKKEKTFTLLDVAISTDRNVVEKKLKY